MVRNLAPEYPGQPLRELLALPLPCGGRRHCGNCGVLLRGALSPISPEEAAFLQKYAAPPEDFAWRLACFCALRGPAEIILPEVAPATANTRGVLPDYDGSSPGSHGLAIDIGTTTITLAAYRFPGKTPVKILSEMNRQSAFGADVISRIGGDREALHGCIRAQLRDMLAQTNVAPGDVSRAVVTGNTAMLHFFAGLDPAGMGRYPFTPQSLFGEEIVWDSLPNAKAYLPPCVTAFVGADIACGALGAGFSRGNSNILLVDVGTNGEMLMRSNGALRCCSVAAGPAFEGAEISMGMPALPGAVDRVWVEQGQLRWHSITAASQPLGAPVRGVCGTGLISALRAFLELGSLDETGAIQPREDDPNLLWGENGPALWLTGSGVTITQRDVRKLQLVKAAVAAGIATMLDEAGLAPGEIERLWLAGGFGSYLDPLDAAAIGMIPQALSERAISGGNLALRGAEMLLFSRELREDAQRLARETREIPLANHPVFQEAFIDEMGFPE
ncbi:MAG: ASKHA domain-containing protein [Oscillospiraceae bacterium]|nr:ASKHA domain-containing protein [Oscillospiraceae bacterium]